MIRPLRIAEVGRAIGERVGAHRRPDGLGQVRAGFYHDHPSVCPSDVESNLIRPHTETGIARLELRLPKRGGTTAKGRAPAGGSRQIKDGRNIVALENERTNAGSVSFEIARFHVGAARERRTCDAGDAAGDRDTRKPGAAYESLERYARNASGDRDTRESGAARKRPASDAGDAAGDGDTRNPGAAIERP